MSFETVTCDAWETALSAVECGHMFACIPVVGPDGQPGIWTSAGPMPEPRDDLDVLAHAIHCIRKARDYAERNGLHPVE